MLAPIRRLLGAFPFPPFVFVFMAAKALAIAPIALVNVKAIIRRLHIGADEAPKRCIKGGWKVASRRMEGA